jgi:hypothetical protein
MAYIRLTGANLWSMSLIYGVECQTISLVALIRLVISDSKSESTRHISRGSGCLLASQLLFQVLRSGYVILTCLVDCLSKVIPQSLRKGSWSLLVS